MSAAHPPVPGLLLALAAALAACGPSQAQQPDPAGAEAAVPPPGAAGEIAFDHVVHAGRAGMPCLTCHAYADKSPVAGIPSGKRCMGCHKFVAKNKPGVKLLAERVEEGRPLRWQRVFDLPEFVYFSHRMHVRAKVDCKECHGDVAVMKVVRQERPFTMGRCLGCHEERKATRDCVACHK
jgi:Cytochrome c7 and related cytochrome c